MAELAVGQLLCIKAAAGPFSRLTIQAAVHIEAITHEKQIDTEMTVWIDVPGSLFANMPLCRIRWLPCLIEEEVKSALALDSFGS